MDVACVGYTQTIKNQPVFLSRASIYETRTTIFTYFIMYACGKLCGGDKEKCDKMGKFILLSLTVLILLLFVGGGGFGLACGLLGLIGGLMGMAVGLVAGLFGAVFGIAAGLIGAFMPLIVVVLIIAGIVNLVRLI